MVGSLSSFPCGPLPVAAMEDWQLVPASAPERTGKRDGESQIGAMVSFVNDVTSDMGTP